MGFRVVKNRDNSPKILLALLLREFRKTWTSQIDGYEGRHEQHRSDRRIREYYDVNSLWLSFGKYRIHNESQKAKC